VRVLFCQASVEDGHFDTFTSEAHLPERFCLECICDL
jgi:hypothetical protein